MVWAHFSGDVDAALLSPSDELDGPLRAHVREVDVAARPPREKYVADDHDLFGFRRNSLETETSTDDSLVHGATCRKCRLLAVIDHRDPKRAGVLERGAHEL